jgi:hypothetical protein
MQTAQLPTNRTVARPNERDHSMGHRRLLAILSAMAIAGMWIPPITSSLWIDEITSYWFVKDGFGDMLDRLSEFQGWPPLYFVVLWPFRVIGGANEFFLRLPSLLCAIGSVYFLYRLAKRLFDSETGVIALAIFAVSGSMIFASIEARPYALPMCTYLAATLALLRWFDEGKHRFGVLYVLAAAATFYSHYLFAVSFAPHVIYAVLRLRSAPTKSRPSVNARHLAGAAVGLALLAAPALVHLAEVYGRRSLLRATWGLSVAGFIGSVIPPLLVGSVLVGLLVARTRTRISVRGLNLLTPGRLLILGILLLPPLVFFGLSLAVPSFRLVFDRYYLPATAALAMLAGALIRSLEPARARRLVVVSVMIISMLGMAGRHYSFHGNEDWRGAAKQIATLVRDPSTPVLVYTSLFETADHDWLTDPEKRDYLLSPFALYPSRGDFLLLPHDFRPSDRRFLENLTRQRLLNHTMVVVLTRFDTFEVWIDARLTSAGYQRTGGGSYGVLALSVYERSGSG